MDNHLTSKPVSIPLDVAVLVRNVFLPTNPNKLRSATPEVKAAAHAFKSAVLAAERVGGYWPDSMKAAAEPKAPASNEWFTPWRAEGLAVYDARGELVAHTGITGNCSMQGAQLERMAQMIADAVNGAAVEPKAPASKLLVECAEAFEESCAHEGQLSSFVDLARRCREAAAEPSEVRHGPCPCCGTEWTPNVAPIARVAIVGGEVSQTEIYAPGLPDGAHDLFPVPLERAPEPSKELVRAMKDLVRAYVNLMESGRDRIVFLGGQCDPVDVMERGDPYLRQAREAIAKAESTVAEPKPQPSNEIVTDANLARALTHWRVANGEYQRWIHQITIAAIEELQRLRTAEPELLVERTETFDEQ